MATVVEKIFSEHALNPGEVSPGDVIWLRLDTRTARDFAGANVVRRYRDEYGASPVDDPERTYFTFDLVVPPKTIPYANNQHLCRQWAAEQHVRVYDVDAGIGSHVAIEEGLARPGTTLVGTDSHLNVLGAVGAFGQGMGDRDIAFAFRTGMTWFEVPPTMRVVVGQTPPYPFTARDLTLAVLGRLGSRGALGRAVEFYGPGIDGLDLAGRITLASQMTEVGAIIGFIGPSPEVLAFLEARAGCSVGAVQADPGADYIDTIQIDIASSEPLIACPPGPTNVTAVRGVAGQRVDSVFIGSCTNGRYEDLAAVAAVVDGKRIHRRVMASVVPATREVYGQALHSGVLETLFSAGFIISNPGCGGCASGHIGMTGAGEVQVSTSNRNFPGKQGAGATYLASPVTAAWCALAGEIAVPEPIAGVG